LTLLTLEMVFEKQKARSKARSGLATRLRREDHEVERPKKLSLVFPELRHTFLPRNQAGVDPACRARCLRGTWWIDLSEASKRT
jgi:hypothetical protein